jgi:integrase
MSISRRRTSSGESRYDVRTRIGGRVVTQTFKRKTDAVRHERLLEADRIRGVALDPVLARLTLADWWRLWWPTTVDLRASSRARDESYWRARIKPTFGDTRLDRISRESIAKWVAELNAEGLAPATVVKAAQILSKCLRAAVDSGRIARSPAERLDLPRIERHEMRFLGPEQVAELAEAIDPAYRALVILGAWGGLRLGEMLALRRHRVNLLHAQVDVAETVATVRGLLVVNPPKTRAGQRRVPLPRVAVDALELHLAELPARAELVFPAARGGYVRAELWRRRTWRAACVATGLGELVEIEGTDRKRYEGLRPHDLRHTAVALWIAAGASPREIATRAGHTSVVTVLDRYGHLLPGSEDRVNVALDALAATSAEPLALPR